MGAIAARAAMDAGLTRAHLREFHETLFALLDEQDKAREERMARRHG